MEVVDPTVSAVFHRESGRRYPLFVRGEGRFLYDSSGRPYLDGVGGGACVTVIGYGNEHVLRAASEQMQRLTFVHNQKYANEPQEMLAARLAGHAPGGVTRAFFVQGGAEANEAALRLIRAYHIARGEPERDVIVTQSQGYHGSTIGTLALTGRLVLHAPVEPWLPPFQHIAPFHCYRCPYGQTYGSCDIACAGVLESIADRVGPRRIAAFLMETIPTSAAPGLVPPPEFLPRVRDWCDRVGALLVLDEVVTGMGRTGKWFACEHWGAVPDALTIAKGLGAGYTPIGALLTHQRVYDAIASASGEFEHGHTLNGNPLSCAVANAVLDVIEEHDLVRRSGELGAWLKAELTAALADVDVVGEIRGLGTLIGIEYVRSRTDRVFLDEGLQFGRAVELEAMARGLLVYGTQSTSSGYVGDGTIVAPAYTMTDSEVEDLVRILRDSVRAVARRIPSGPARNVPIAVGHSPA